MSNRINEVFDALKVRGEAALVAFVTAGDPWPTSEQTANLVVSLAEAGADVIELGIPYSDPQADGPSVQAASQRALEHGVNPPFVLNAVRQARSHTQVPIILMTYYNSVWRCGVERFAGDAADAGVDGLIITDLPPEEAGDWLEHSERAGLATVFMIAPTSTTARIKAVASKMHSGFVYCVSRTGVTGARKEAPAELSELIERIRQETPLPVCVGFGISTPEHVAQVSKIADGAVIGSALVDFLDQNFDSPTVQADLFDLVSGWKQATRRV